jgi:hypothetical protein
MRGISAHSNGFQTCRALAPAADPARRRRLPRRIPLQAALPQAGRRPARPHGGACPDTRSAARIWAIRADRKTCCSTKPGETAQRIDKAFSWDAPLSAHGMMHMVISNAHAGDPYGIDVLFSTWPTWPGTRR